MPRARISPAHSLVDRERLAVLAGLARARRRWDLRNPYLDDFSIAVVTTDYPLAIDLPLHDSALQAKGLAYWWGINGAQSGRERNRQKKARHAPVALSRWRRSSASSARPR